MSRKSTILALCFSFAIPATMAFAKGEPQPSNNHGSKLFFKGKPATEPGDDRGGNNPGTGVDDNNNNRHRQRGKTPTALIAKGKPATEPGDDRGGNNPGTGVDDNNNNRRRQRGKTA